MPALIVGLGNPGKEYAGTRHNIGFMVVDELARRGGLRWDKPRLKAEQTKGSLAGRDVVLAKPQTYMNSSGVSVVQLVKWYKVPLDQLLVISDDLDLPFGTLRLRGEGSAGGQKGVASIIQQLRTDAFPRLRLGIGRPRWGDPADYVLTRFGKDQADELADTIARAADAAEVWLAEGLIPAMNRFNGAKSKV
ncbi:MAG: Peptidyl-tRNA hydrolase [uncultured Thermomicrobiales bacterium]|uniref:Peptidyl-tRNA hydrolase n=1 Tax=uncultured Thermomicrobiales bacterium TaxID=1645740 RepID=A0A6J4USJ2_9BACT|nr:MAG: Peptidyl-tRNA hydrolase [uncultured Thermomicrobiales bacterium]